MVEFRDAHRRPFTSFLSFVLVSGLFAFGRSRSLQQQQQQIWRVHSKLGIIPVFMLLLFLSNSGNIPDTAFSCVQNGEVISLKIANLCPKSNCWQVLYYCLLSWESCKFSAARFLSFYKQLTYQLVSEIANPSRSISPAASVSSERTNGSSKLDRWEDSDGRLQIMLQLESSLQGSYPF